MTDLDELERKARAILALPSYWRYYTQREQAAATLALIERVRAAEVARAPEPTEEQLERAAFEFWRFDCEGGEPAYTWDECKDPECEDGVKWHKNYRRKAWAVLTAGFAGQSPSKMTPLKP